MDVARSERMVILDPSTVGSASSRTLNDCSTLDNMFRGCGAIKPFTLMDLPFTHTSESRVEVERYWSYSLSGEGVGLIPEQVDRGPLNADDSVLVLVSRE